MQRVWKAKNAEDPKTVKARKKIQKQVAPVETKQPNAIFSDLYQGLFPIYYLVKFCGMLPVNFRRTNRRYVGRISCLFVLYGVLLMSSCLFCQMWGLWRDLRQGWQNSTRLSSETAITVTCCDVLAVFSVMAVAILGAPFRWNYLQSAMNKLIQVDEKFRISSPKRLRRVAIITSITVLTYLVTICSLDYATWKYSNSVKRPNLSSDKGPINYAPIYFMYFIITVFEIFYCVCTYNLGVRFERLNITLEKQSRSKEVINYFFKDLGFGSSMKNEQMVEFIKSDLGYGLNKKADSTVWPITENLEVEQNVAEQISKLIIQHAHLSDIVILLNKCFGAPILFAVISCLVHLIITPYFLYMEINDEKYLWQTITMQCAWCVYHCVRLALLVQPCYFTCLKGNKTGVIISALLSSNWGPQVQKRLEIFSLQLILRPLEFNACGLFAINRALLASVAGAVTTYLVILIQFQTSDDEKGTKMMLKNATDFLLKNTTKKT